jgi:uncharacterized protein (UPF0548 family)
MFTPAKSSAAEIEKHIAAAKLTPTDGPRLLSIERQIGRPASGFAHDRSRSRIGLGEASLLAAKQALGQWEQFNLGWVRVANPDAAIAVGEIIAVEARTLGLWTLNLSRITETIDHPTRFGFIYNTTELHVEQGEERFLIELDPASGEVWYELEAVSRPRLPLARLGYPLTRYFQRKFAQDSHRRMKIIVARE